jgi:uncharacterized protein YjdB
LIGPNGGSVVSADGNAELIIPAGALDALTDVVITPVTTSLFADDALYVPGTGYQIAPAPLPLRLRATLRITYDPSKLPTGAFAEQLRLRERENGLWRETQSNELQALRVKGSVARFGTFGLLVQPALGTMIGPDGGTVSSADGNVELVIPPGAVATPVDVLIEPAVETPFIYDNLFVSGTAYQIKPRGFELLVEGQLRMRFDPKKVPPGIYQDQLRIHERELENNRWLDAAPAELGENQLTALVRSFGFYAILGTFPHNLVASSITVWPAYLELEEGTSTALQATVRDETGTIKKFPVVWTSSDNAVVTVALDGKVTGIRTGKAFVTAKAGVLEAKATIDVFPKIGSITLAPASASLLVGDTLRITATVRDVAGKILNRPVTWQSSAPGIAKVQAGFVTALSEGTAVITAKSGSGRCKATITVTPRIGRVVIDGPREQMLRIGHTLRLTATVYDGTGVPVEVLPTWSTKHPLIAAVDQTGLVKANGKGNSLVIASVGAARDSVWIIGFGDQVKYGNNASVPIVFADGIGLTGKKLRDELGIRPFASEGIPVDDKPFWWTGNAPTYQTYSEQRTFNTWRPEWINGIERPKYNAKILWRVNAPLDKSHGPRAIRVQQVLLATDLQMRGFAMIPTDPESSLPMYGADGTTAMFTPVIYTAGAWIIVQKLHGEGSEIAAVTEHQAVAEVDVTGKVVYDFILNPDGWDPPQRFDRHGWYRIKFRLASKANLELTAAGAMDGAIQPHFTTRESWIDVYVP